MRFARSTAATALALLGNFVGAGLPCFAQQPWQQIQMPSAEAVRRAWVTPPPEYGPEPYYGLNGAVDESVIDRDLDSMKQLGYGAVTVQAGYGMPFAYLSPEYFTFFRTFVLAAKQRGLRVWIVDDAGYPSGFAGGKFTELRPDLRMQALAVAERIPAHAGDVIKHPVSPTTVAVSALNSADGSSVTIPVTNNEIDWTAPAGDWTITVVEHRFSTSPTRSDTNPKRVKDGSQSLEDYLDPAATGQYLEFTHDAYKKAVGDEFGKTILGFRGDEPDYSISGLPWTPRFFDRFTQLKGYDIKPYLASFLLPKGAEMNDKQQRAKADYYDVFSQMFRDGFFKPQGDWCAANHLEYQVHLNHEEMEMQLTHSEGEFFRDMRYVQVPGIDSIWHQIWTDTISDFPRLASSAAHVYGHPRAFTESFAAYRPEPDLPMVRYILNEQFARGINLVETMYFPASTGGRGGPARYMQASGYPALLAYVRRVSYLTSMGRPDAGVAVFLPSSSMWLGDAESDKAFVSTERLLSEHQIDFDIVDEDAIASAMKLEGGAFVTMSGNRLHTVIVPDAKVLSQAAVTRLERFVHGGGHVLFLGGTPQLIAGRTMLDARPATAKNFAWAQTFNATLPETPTPPAQPPASAPELMTVSPELLHAVGTAVGAQEITLSNATTALRVTHRKWRDAEIYFIFNESATPVSEDVKFSKPVHHVEVWDADAGTTTNALTSKGALAMEWKAYESRILIVQ